MEKPYNVTKVSVNYLRKITKKRGTDFDSVEVGVSLFADVMDQEMLAGILTDLWSTAKQNVKASLLPVLQGDEDAVKDIFLGLPAEFQERAQVEVTTADGETKLVNAKVGPNGEVDFRKPKSE